MEELRVDRGGEVRRWHEPIALSAAVLLDLVGSLVDEAVLAKELWNLVLGEGGLGLGVVVRDVVGFVGSGHGWMGVGGGYV